MAQKWSNNASSTLASGIAAEATTLTLASGADFPTLAEGDEFLLTLASGTPENLWEIVKVTARTGGACTVTRAQEGTTARAWSTGTTASLRLTAGTLETILAGLGGGSSNPTLPDGVPEALPAVGSYQLFIAPGFDDRDRLGAFHGMTSGTSDEVIITSGDVTSARFAWHMFADDPLISWCATSDPASQWVVFETPSPCIFYGYGLMVQDGYPQYMPKAWKIQGSASADGPWTDLSIEANYSQRSWLSGTFSMFDVADTSTAYKFHRFLVTEPEYTGFPAISKMMISTGTPTLFARDSAGAITRLR